MRIERCDPRDTKWELNRPAYQVHFWLQPAVLGGAAARNLGWTAEEFEITDADVHEVLAWASEAAEGREFGVFVVVDHDDERGLIRLAGVDPTRHDWARWRAPCSRPVRVSDATSMRPSSAWP